jgi:hypothetical protein
MIISHRYRPDSDRRTGEFLPLPALDTAAVMEVFRRLLLERQALCGDRLEDVLISGFQSTASIPGARTILIENSKVVRQ